ncbi:hypothetical protein EYF80_001910 [Liparis tanakae]|uniref:Uncharacterized protein n=1 Tax=Liparis tanakae TaxID=230148 RepID=A0A4Z2JCK7_9TELE|nr:hypothetical protein EYF80_001910 [Liparis tanakae]
MAAELFQATWGKGEHMGQSTVGSSKTSAVVEFFSQIIEVTLEDADVYRREKREERRPPAEEEVLRILGGADKRICFTDFISSRS